MISNFVETPHSMISPAAALPTSASLGSIQEHRRRLTSQVATLKFDVVAFFTVWVGKNVILLHTIVALKNTVQITACRISTGRSHVPYGKQ